MGSDDPRDRTLTKVAPRVGWGPGRAEEINALCKLVEAQHPRADLHQLKHRLAPLLAKASAVLQVGKPGGKKPATLIRDQLEQVSLQAPDEAIEAMERLHPIVLEYLDLILESENPEFLPASVESTSADLRDLAQRRHRLVVERGADLIPIVRRGTEDPWSFIAGLVAELLNDVTGVEPRRSWNSYREEDTGWGLTFFRAFAGVVVAPEKPPKLAKIWRTALESRGAKGAGMLGAHSRAEK